MVGVGVYMDVLGNYSNDYSIMQEISHSKSK